MRCMKMLITRFCQSFLGVTCQMKFSWEIQCKQWMVIRKMKGIKCRKKRMSQKSKKNLTLRLSNRPLAQWKWTVSLLSIKLLLIRKLMTTEKNKFQNFVNFFQRSVLSKNDYFNACISRWINKAFCLFLSKGNQKFTIWSRGRNK